MADQQIPPEKISTFVVFFKQQQQQLQQFIVSASCGPARPAAGCSHTAAFSFTLAPYRKPPAQR